MASHSYNEQLDGDKFKNNRFDCSNDTPKQWIPTKVFISEWIRNYKSSDIINDLIAGFTVFILLIPQGMAYAVVAGMPPVYGLYAASFPQFIYAILGTSRHISIGPMSTTSLMLGLAIQNQDLQEQSDEYIRAIFNLTLMVGLITYLIGLLQAGVFVNFLSNSVISGFITASSLIITLSQLKYILGISVPRLKYSHQIILYIFKHLRESNPYALTIGVSSWILLSWVKYLRKQYKEKIDENQSIKSLYILSNAASLIAIIAAALIARVLVLYGKEIQIVGTVPRE